MSDSGRKINSNIDNPIDNILIGLCEPLSILLNKYTNITPNIITTIGLIIGLVCVYCLNHQYYLISIPLYWITYFLDCLDGYYARKYNMTSNLGDYYDHFRDIIITCLIFVVLFTKMSKYNYEYIFAFIFVLFAICMMIHFGCQEANSHNTKHDYLLSYFTKWCAGKHYINYTKYVGCGTFTLIISICIIYLYYLELKAA